MPSIWKTVSARYSPSSSRHQIEQIPRKTFSTSAPFQFFRQVLIIFNFFFRYRFLWHHYEFWFSATPSFAVYTFFFVKILMRYLPEICISMGIFPSNGSASKQQSEKSSLITILFSSTSLYYFENSARLKSLCASKSFIRQGENRPKEPNSYSTIGISTRPSIKPGTWNIPEHAGTFRNIPEHPGTWKIF